MKRLFLKTTYLISAVTLMATMAFIGCQKRDVDLQNGDGRSDAKADTYITLALNLGSMSAPNKAALRGEDVDHHNPHPIESEREWKGRDLINEIILYLFETTGGGAAEVKSFKGNQVPRPDGENKIILTPWQTTPGYKTIYCIVNPNDEVRNALNAAKGSEAAFKTAYSQAYDFLVKDESEFDTYWNSPVNALYKKMFDETDFSESTRNHLMTFNKHVTVVKPTIAFTKPDETKLEKDRPTGNQLTPVYPNQLGDVIMMSGDPVKVYIHPHVSKEAAKQGPANNVKLLMRRTVAQCGVTLNGEILSNYPSGNGTKELAIGEGADKITLNEIKWNVVQFEAKSYLYAQGGSAAETTRSPQYNFVPTPAAKYSESAYFYPKVNGIEDLKKWNDVPSYTEFATSGNEQVQTHKYTKNSPAYLVAYPSYLSMEESKQLARFYFSPRYITETTHPYNALSYRKGNTAYFVITAIYTPSVNQMAEGVEPDPVTIDDDVPDENHTPTLYQGVVDGLYYYDYKEAYKMNNNGQSPEKIPTPEEAVKIKGDNVITLVNGQCYYIAWVNPDTNKPETWATSPVVRNNFYHMNITGFSGRGYSGIPFLPGNDHPLLPDPDEPVPSPEDPLKNEKTHMTSTVTVESWGVHAYEISF